MVAITTVGLDIAKSVFQVHGIDAHGSVVVRRQLKRRYVLAFFKKLPPSLVGIEACATSHHWSRELQALGHTVRLIPPAYVKPYVKRHKNDAADVVSSTRKASLSRKASSLERKHALVVGPVSPPAPSSVTGFISDAIATLGRKPR
jgi:transposase